MRNVNRSCSAYVCGMSGRSQFYMNVGMTLSIGVYAVGGAFFMELFKGPNQWNGLSLAVELFGLLMFLALTFACFEKVYEKIDDNRE